MIGYVTLGTNDLARAVAFYDALFDSVGIGRLMEVEDVYVAWSRAFNEPGFGITKPYNQQAASVGNGVMVALIMESKEQVNAFYNKALELGGTDEGEPGFRNEFDGHKFYAAYFRDLDGNKLNAFFYGSGISS